jgi:hypothetical protein
MRAYRGGNAVFAEPPVAEAALGGTSVIWSW